MSKLEVKVEITLQHSERQSWASLKSLFKKREFEAELQSLDHQIDFLEGRRKKLCGKIQRVEKAADKSHQTDKNQPAEKAADKSDQTDKSLKDQAE